MVDAERTTIGKLLSPKTTTSHFVEAISTLLGIPMPWELAPDDEPDPNPKSEPAIAPVPTPTRTPDRLDEVLRWIPDDQRDRAAAILYGAFGPLRSREN